MFTTIAAYAISLLGAWLASAIVFVPLGLVVRPALAGLNRFFESTLSDERLAQGQGVVIFEYLLSSVMFFGGIAVGIAKVLIAVQVFRYFDKVPGALIALMFIAISSFTFVAEIPQWKRDGMRAGAIGSILGVIYGWFAMFP